MNMPDHPGEAIQNSTKRDFIKSYKVKAKQKRTLAEKAADFLTSQFGSFGFLILNLGWFTVWIAINVGLVPGIEPFDPFPFIFLTLTVSLEAIVLAIIVLMSQNREAKVNSLRDEIDTRIDIVAEEEITKALEILTKIAQKQGIDLSRDRKLKKMVKPVNKHYLEKKFEKEV